VTWLALAVVPEYWCAIPSACSVHRRQRTNPSSTQAAVRGGRSRAYAQVIAAGGDAAAVATALAASRSAAVAAPAPEEAGRRRTSTSPSYRRGNIAEAAAPAEEGQPAGGDGGDRTAHAPLSAPSAAAEQGAALPAEYQRLTDLLVAVQHALTLLRIRGGATTVDAVSAVVAHLQGRTCGVTHLATLQAALALCEEPGESHAMAMSWQRVPRRKGEVPEEQLVISLPPPPRGSTTHDEALLRALRQRLEEHTAGEVAPAIEPAELPVRPSVLAAAAAAAARGAGAAQTEEAQARLQAGQVVRAAEAAEAAPKAVQQLVHAGGVSVAALRAAAAAEVAAADVQATAAARAAARRAARLPRLLDAIRSWLVGHNRSAAPLPDLVTALRAGVSAGSQVTGAVSDDVEEMTAQVMALVTALPEWIVAEPSVTAGCEGPILRFNPRCEMQPLRRRLAAEAQRAGEALKTLAR
jgi:hypothetical protein